MRGELLLDVFKKAQPFVEKHATSILTGVAAVGVVATAVTAAKAAPKAIKRLEQVKEEKGEELTKIEKFKAAAPIYIPTVIVGASTIACMLSAHIMDLRKQEALINAYNVLNDSYTEYRAKTVEMYGEEADEKIKEAIAKDKYEEAEKEEKPHHTDALLFYDEWSNRYFWRTMDEVKDAEYKLNRNFALRGYAELNEFYEFLFLDPTEFGATVGWSMEAGGVFYGYSWVDFYHKYHPSDNPNEPGYYTIEMPFNPTADFMDY